MSTKDSTPIAVASRGFLRHPVLRKELLERYSDVRFNDEGRVLQGGALIEFARGRRKLIISLERIDEGILAALPELEVVSKHGVGIDMLDLQAMIRHGVRLGWAAGINKRSVTELAIALMISLLRQVPLASRDLSEGKWMNRTGRQLSDSAVGIIGCGNIGKDLTVILRAFGCKVLAHDLRDFPDFFAAHQVEPVGLEELLSRSDVVSIHVPLNDGTREILSAQKLALMKPSALLINTARGGLVDEVALKAMLIEGRLGGAAFDVFATEPPVDTELLNLPNFLATPHLGGSSEEAVLAAGRAAIKGLDENRVPGDDYPIAGQT